ncbi:uncharacterized protein LOC111023470 isoform X1 [Momordica charantia]|uniref:Uncharacterized protein LOC111023470 isoform X1 n=1 Tax=Momordica charantia TaxID=3673 RepID=A0A6J1DSE4_MOMCH|nr:uncharacterized protein LOC111023470 isoform X1 [Momordica charantia]
METHKDLQEFQNHHTNPKTTGFEVESNISFRESWPQIQALLRQLIHKEVEKEVERKIHALFPSLPSSPRNATDHLSPNFFIHRPNSQEDRSLSCRIQERYSGFSSRIDVMPSSFPVVCRNCEGIVFVPLMNFSNPCP